MNYKQVLKEGEWFDPETSRITKIEILDYVKMREKGLPTNVAWDAIKHCKVTTTGTTFWQLSESYLNSIERPIGLFQPPADFARWILTELNMILLVRDFLNTYYGSRWYDLIPENEITEGIHTGVHELGGNSDASIVVRFCSPSVKGGKVLVLWKYQETKEEVIN